MFCEVSSFDYLKYSSKILVSIAVGVEKKKNWSMFEILETNMSASSAWLVWGSLSLFYLLQFLLRIITNVINDQIVLKYSIDADGIGTFAGIWYVGYVLLHIPMAMLLDRFSAKKVIPTCVLLSIVGFMPIIYSESFVAAVWGRFFIGAGSSASALGAFKLLRSAFGEDKFPRMLGSMATIGLVGAAVGTGPIESLISYCGWERVMTFIIYYGLATALICYLCLPSKLSTSEFSFRSVLRDFKYIFSQHRVLLFCLFGGLLIGPLEGFADAWSNKYLRTVYGLSNEIAGKITTMIYLGMGVGFIVLGHIFERTRASYSIIIICGIAMTVAFSTVILQMTYSVTLLMLLFFIIGFFSAYQVFVISGAIRMVSSQHSTLTSAIANMIMMGCGFLFHKIVGKVIKYYSSSYDFYALGFIKCQINGFFISLMIIDISIVIGTIGVYMIATLPPKAKKNNKVSCSF